MTMIKSLAHVCIKTTDLEKTTGFYCGILGMKKVFDFTRKGQVIGSYYAASPRAFIEVFEEKHLPPGANNRNPNHFCLESDDLVTVRQALLDGGYAPREITMGADHSLQFWVHDPNGIDMEFHQYTDRSAQFTGEAVEVDW